MGEKGERGQRTEGGRRKGRGGEGGEGREVGEEGAKEGQKGGGERRKGVIESEKKKKGCYICCVVCLVVTESTAQAQGRAERESTCCTGFIYYSVSSYDEKAAVLCPLLCPLTMKRPPFSVQEGIPVSASSFIHMSRVYLMSGEEGKG